MGHLLFYLVHLAGLGGDAGWGGHGDLGVLALPQPLSAWNLRSFSFFSDLSLTGPSVIL